MGLQSDAARILEEAGEPLHAKDIAERMISAGLWEADQKNPGASLGGKLTADIKKFKKQSRFVKVAPQTFALNAAAAEMTADNAAQDDLTDGADEIADNDLNANIDVEASPGMSFADCACKVLEVHGNRQPMHYADIADKAMQEGWLVSNSEAPEIVMYALVVTEIKRHQKRGGTPRFVQHGRGMIGLSDWLGKKVPIQQGQHNERVIKVLLERMLAMKPGEFKELISELLAEMGFEMVKINRLKDNAGMHVRGTLIIGHAMRIKMAIRIKQLALDTLVTSDDITEVRDSLSKHEQGMVITTSDFADDARKQANKASHASIGLISGEELVFLVMEHGIGVQR